MKIGLIGCGEIATQMHIPAVLATSGVDFAWIMDVDHKQAESVAERFAIGPVVDQIPAANGDHDAVIITTPPHVRPCLSIAAFRAGYHVLAEKPLANNVAECRSQIDAAKSSRKRLAVSHQYRFWPARRRIAEWIDQGKLGPVKSVAMSQGKPYSWVSKTGYTMLRDQVPGGVLINAGIHPLDTLLWWLGDPESIEYRDDSLGGLESNFEMHLCFSDGAEASLAQSRTSNLKDEIRLKFRDGEICLPTYSRNEFTVIQNGQTECLSVSECDDPLGPVISQLTDFRDAVTNGKEPSVDGEQATRCIDVIERCYRMKRQRTLPDHAPVPGKLW